jgi:hypothetical protein
MASDYAIKSIGLIDFIHMSDIASEMPFQNTSLLPVTCTRSTTYSNNEECAGLCAVHRIAVSMGNSDGSSRQEVKITPHAATR